MTESAKNNNTPSLSIPTSLSDKIDGGINVSTWSIKNPVPSILLFILLTLGGLYAFKLMKIQNFPDIDLPMVTVSAAMPGASASQLETEVARKLENAIATLQGLKHIQTTIQEGIVSLLAEFIIEKPTQEALDDVRSAVASVRYDLPADLRDPVVKKVDLAGLPILTYTVSSSGMTEEGLSWFVDNTVARALMGVRGVGAISRVGGVNREVSVLIDPSRLLALNISAGEISRQLKLVQQESAAGRTDLGGSEQAMKITGVVRDAEELSQMPIFLNDGRRVRLNQVADVRDAFAERRSAAFLDGSPVVGFEISRSRGAGEIEVAEGVSRVLESLKKKNPDIKISEAFNFVDPVQEAYEGSMQMLYEGALLAVIVVLLFLRDSRATLISAAALPLSIIPAFAGMYLLGFTINVVTLLALSLVVGVLVDDAIVEVENISRHLRMGKTPYQASIEAADEIGMAVIATTFTLISVFLPTAFMGGVPGKFFVQFGWTAAISVFASLAVARMLTPMMAAHCLKKYSHAVEEDGRVMKAYLRLVALCLRHHVLTMLVAVLFFVGALGLAGTLKTDFLPANDVSETQVRLELPPGSTLQQSVSIAERARQIIAKKPYVKVVYTTIGGGAAGGDPFASAGAGEVRSSTLTIRLSPREERSGLTTRAIEAQLRSALTVLPGVRVAVGLPGSSQPYFLVLSSENKDVLSAHAKKVMKDLRSLRGIGNITSNLSMVQPELVLRPDFERAADLGVTSSAVADFLRVATIGDYDQNLPKLNLLERQVPIVARLPIDARKDRELLMQLSVAGARGPVRLGAISSSSIESGPSQINRYDRQRNIKFEIELGSRSLGDVQSAVLALPSMVSLPPGVVRASIGDAEAMGELMAGFGMAMLAGVVCIYVVLVLLFKDFVQPVTILAALVLSIPGAFLALWISRQSISMPSMIGLIMLMGIATKNSILLVEYAIMFRQKNGASRMDALLDACHKRARPIVMTTVAMGAGMAPAIFGWGKGDFTFRAPMATVVTGGLITSTFLSLLVIPVVFTYVDDAVRLFSRWVLRRDYAGSSSVR